MTRAAWQSPARLVTWRSRARGGGATSWRAASPRCLLLRLNEELFPTAWGLFISRGNIHLMGADTASAEAAFREAARRNPADDEARGRLRDIGRRP